jgi:hypothetical protein
MMGPGGGGVTGITDNKDQCPCCGLDTYRLVTNKLYPNNPVNLGEGKCKRNDESTFSESLKLQSTFSETCELSVTH